MSAPPPPSGSSNGSRKRILPIPSSSMSSNPFAAATQDADLRLSKMARSTSHDGEKPPLVHGDDIPLPIHVDNIHHGEDDDADDADDDTIDALDAVRIHVISKEHTNSTDGCGFNPHAYLQKIQEHSVPPAVGGHALEYANQVFGDDETIKRPPSCPRAALVHVFIHTPSCLALVTTTPTEAFKDAPPREHPVNLLQKHAFAEPAKLFTSIDEFNAAIAEAKANSLPLLPNAEPIAVAPMQLEDDTTTQMAVSRLNLADEACLRLRAQLDAITVLSVDAGSAVLEECEETSQEERAGNLGGEGWEMYAAHTTQAPVKLLGFMAVYRFYAFPVDRCRLRLSQLVTLPSFRRKGVGALMMRALYRSASDPKQRGGLSVVDVSLEDPTEETRRLRDSEDVRRLLSDDYFVKAADASWEKASQGGSLKLPADVSRRMGESFQIAKMQRRRAWEVLLSCRRNGEVSPELLKLITRRVLAEGGCAEKLSEKLQRKRMFDSGGASNNDEEVSAFVMWRASRSMIEAYKDPSKILLQALSGAKTAAGGHGMGGSRGMANFLPSIPEPAVSEANLKEQKEKEVVDPEKVEELVGEAVQDVRRAVTAATRR